MEEISVQELKKKFDDKEDFILLDVRTIDESVRNILRIKYQLGLFQRPYTPVKVSNFQGDSKRYFTFGCI